MKALVEKQKECFESQQTKDLLFRKKQLSKLEQVLKENEKALYEAIYSDFKKSEFDTYTSELALLYHDIKQAKKCLNNWSRIKKVPTNFLNFPAKSYIVPEPLGVCLVIGAWNYPYQLSLAPAIAAIAAGNTVIIKPSEIPKNTSAILATIINNNFDASFLTVVEGGIPETTQLLNQDFDKIFFTGSTPVGKIVYQAAAKKLIPVTLELGGKSPAFVTESANLKMAVKRLVWAKFLNAGQTCIAPDYVLVDKKIESEFINLVVSEIKKEKFDISNGNYVQIINYKNIERLKKLLDTSKIFYGGEVDEENRIFNPTVMHNVTFSDAVMKDEIFGPLLPVISYENLDQAIKSAKQLPKPLSCYVFSSKKNEIKNVLSKFSFGGGAINEAIMHISNPNLPFGGVGQSGMGSYHGEAGFRTFSHYKSILEKPTWLELNIKYYPHTEKKLKIIKQLFKF